MKRLIIFIFGYFLLYPAISQVDPGSKEIKTRKVIQFSGIVVGGDSLYGIPGVTIYVPTAGRGTVTSMVGYFSMPTLVGDSVVIRAYGFKEKNLIIPEAPDSKLSVIVELKEDTLLMPEIEIFPWPTEELFKKAFLSLKLPHTDIDNMHKNLNEQVTKRMMYSMDKDGTQNHKYYMQQQVERQDKKMMYDKNYFQNFMNPFAWANFIKQVKNGDLKNKSKDYDYEDEEDE